MTTTTKKLNDTNTNTNIYIIDSNDNVTDVLERETPVKETPKKKAPKATKKKAPKVVKKETKEINNIPEFKNIDNSKKDHKYYNRNFKNVSKNTQGTVENGIKSFLSFEFNKFEQLNYLLNKKDNAMCKLPLKNSLSSQQFSKIRNMLNWYFSGFLTDWEYCFDTKFKSSDIKDKEFSFTREYIEESENGDDIIRIDNTEKCFFDTSNNSLYITHEDKNSCVEFLLEVLDGNEF